MRHFQNLGLTSPVEVLFEVPSKLPQMLDSGEVQAILVSSIEAFRRDCRVVDGVSISSQRAVMSVRLFSDVPFKQVRTLTPDPSSMTSNALAQIILEELFSSRPELSDGGQAQVLIGDAGMRREDGNFILDLGKAWYELTGLPFVWAVWLGNPDLPVELADYLRAASQWGQRNLYSYLVEIAEQTDFEYEVAEKYLSKIMDYDLGANHRGALESFGKRLERRSLVPSAEPLKFV